MTDDKTHDGDKALIHGALTGEGLIELTPGVLQTLMDNIKARYADFGERYPALVEACPDEMRLAVTQWVMKHIVEHAHDGGTYRHLIYTRLGFGPEAYVPLCGDGLTISNEFTITEAVPLDDAKLSERLLDMGKSERQPITFEGGQEPWATICDAAFRIQALSEALGVEQEKRRRVQAELDALIAERNPA